MKLPRKYSSRNIFLMWGRRRICSTLNVVKEYEDRLKNLSNHEKRIRIDLNGTGKKSSKYFFDKNKYVYVRTRNDIRKFDEMEAGQGNRGPIADTSSSAVSTTTTSASVISTTAASSMRRDRKRAQSLKALMKTYDLSRDEIIYMQFIRKIKTKHIYSLLNNLRKNVYLDKKKEDILLNCIYKYLAYNCYAISRNEFFFFLHIFPQKMKYCYKSLSYLRNVLKKDKISVRECISLVIEINVLHINMHIKNDYIYFFKRNINKITIFDIMILLTKGSYLFTICQNEHVQESLDNLFLNDLIHNIKDKKVHLNGELKNAYINFILYHPKYSNYFFKYIFNDIHVVLYQKVVLSNLDKVQGNYEFFQRVAKIESPSITINRMNSLLFHNSAIFHQRKNEQLKIKVFPSHITSPRGIHVTEATTSAAVSCEHVIGKENDEQRCVTNPDEFFSEAKDRIMENAGESTQDISTHSTGAARGGTTNCIPPFTQNGTLHSQRKWFHLISPADKLKSTIFDELKEKYKIPTKVTDKNVKMVLTFLKMTFFSKTSILNEAFSKDSIFRVMSSFKKGEIKTGNDLNKVLSRLISIWNWRNSSKEIALTGCFSTLLESDKRAQNRHADKTSPFPVLDASQAIDKRTNGNAATISKDTLPESPTNVLRLGEEHGKHPIPKAELNCMVKILFYLCNSFHLYFKKEKRSNKLSRDVYPGEELHRRVEQIFYDMFTHIFKSIYTVNISNYFYIFSAICKFVYIKPDGMVMTLTNHNEKMKKLLHIMHTIRASQYDIIKSIVNDKDNQRYLLFSEKNIADVESVKQEKFDFNKLHEIIISKFAVETQLKGKHLADSYDFLLMLLTTYLDGSTFRITNFLITIFYVSKIVPLNLREEYHFESRLQKGRERFTNKHLYTFDGTSGKRAFLNESYISYIQQFRKKEETNFPNSLYNIVTQNGKYISRCNIFESIENLFRRKKNMFSLDDTLNFVFIYSLNELYHSNVYYDISRHLYQFDLSQLDDKTKMLLFLLLSHYKYSYKPLFFSLLRQILNKEKTVERSNVYFLCAILLVLIKDSHLKIKGETYVKRQFGTFKWDYFFPLQLFTLENISRFAKNKILKLETTLGSSTTVGKYDHTNVKENINYSHFPFRFHMKQFKGDLKKGIPQMVQRCIELDKMRREDEKHMRTCEVENVWDSRMMNKRELPLFHFDDTIESEMLKICLNFLSYEYAMKNFLIRKRSLYYDVLLHLRVGNIEYPTGK
ncbi:conserved Plasmodium protein, unknown function [Plasmodium ovale]|uniref:Uncharacterized protein n=2 Tax=Plasmodium ovale TaxID=36330 RepID=A0A1A8VPL9_PLAOA|nr:conserved Plasmodium protein, unknown function [Plasmodium ovale curtisi]SBS81270.1 conserved Plasmodium protein, unknown function [Plasmodium ovale curtisi]SCN43051.1 conserved Plasmodium protein, unknown function [Plasmodium ovale]